ncbi:hypothetical protein NESM_000804000 [Novymonas esmeraldas]|uniref:ATP-dependent DNA helicase n=1 Tax=Novymonas esmeraldas TaxID=1808958 RepID=A0AAW0EYS8_9TRYP
MRYVRVYGDGVRIAAGSRWLCSSASEVWRGGHRTTLVYQHSSQPLQGESACEPHSPATSPGVVGGRHSAVVTGSFAAAPTSRVIGGVHQRCCLTPAAWPSALYWQRCAIAAVASRRKAPLTRRGGQETHKGEATAAVVARHGAAALRRKRAAPPTAAIAKGAARTRVGVPASKKKRRSPAALSRRRVGRRSPAHVDPHGDSSDYVGLFDLVAQAGAATPSAHADPSPPGTTSAEGAHGQPCRRRHGVHVVPPVQSGASGTCLDEGDCTTPAAALSDSSPRGRAGGASDSCIGDGVQQHPRWPITSPPPAALDTIQSRAVEWALRGHNLFVTGGAGTGKSHTLRAIVAALRQREAEEMRETLRAVAAAQAPAGHAAQAAEASLAADIEKVEKSSPVESPAHRTRGESQQNAGTQPHAHAPRHTQAPCSTSSSSPSPSAQHRSNVFVTATTGLAAVQLHGMTINTFAGIGIGRGTPEELYRRVQRSSPAAKRWRTCRVLLIDEVSMLDASLFQMLDYIARRVRRRASVPFGGVQVILCGDFFQLPPIQQRNGPPLKSSAAAPPQARPCTSAPLGAFTIANIEHYLSARFGANSMAAAATETSASPSSHSLPSQDCATGAPEAHPEENLTHAASCAFCFQTAAWQDLRLCAVVLEHPHRQATDLNFRDILNEVRRGALSPSACRALETRCVHPTDGAPPAAGASAPREAPAAAAAAEGAVAATATRATACGSLVAAGVRLCATNSEVDARNAFFFAQLSPRHPPQRGSGDAAATPGGAASESAPLHVYRACDSTTVERSSVSEATPSNISATLNETQLLPEVALKVGTRVMLLGNVAPNHRLVNGVVGVVTGFLHPLELIVLTDYVALRIIESRGSTAKGSDDAPHPPWVQKLLDRSGFHRAEDVLACVDTFQGLDAGALWWRMRRQLRRQKDGHHDCRPTAGARQPTTAASLEPRRIPYESFFPPMHYAYLRRLVGTPAAQQPHAQASAAHGRHRLPMLRCLLDLTAAELTEERLPVVRFEMATAASAATPGASDSGASLSRGSRGSARVVFAIVSAIKQDVWGSSSTTSGDSNGMVEDNGKRRDHGVASRTQLPLRHAWALTVHKSQGLTLQPVQVDMANMRTPGQAYVALSRATSLGELTILNFDPTVVTASAVVQSFYQTLQNDLA